MAKSTDGFFGLQREQSRVKSLIVSEYFTCWSRVMLGKLRMSDPRVQKKEIQYIELFCGPGTFDDGNVSTPVMIVDAVVANDLLSRYLVSHFVDSNEEYCRALEYALSRRPQIARLTHPPQVHCDSVTTRFATEFERISLVPTLLFADPWGYSGLSLRLFEAILKDFGSECIFFFNYDRVNPAISNPKVRDHMDGFFGQERAEELRRVLRPLRSSQRHERVLQALHETFQEHSPKYVLSFRFNSEDGRHIYYLVFVTKHFLGYDIMRDIMARHSSNRIQGVPTFMYDPRDTRSHRLFEVGQPLDDLKELLISNLAGQTLSFRSLYQTHSIGLPYIRRNYKDALYAMYRDGVITVSRKPKANTFADDIVVTFPKGERVSLPRGESAHGNTINH